MLRGHTWVVFRGRAPSRQHSSFGPTSLSCALSNSVSDCEKGRLADHILLFLRQRLVDLTRRSKNPPHQGAKATLNFHSMQWFANTIFRSSLLIVDPLSDTSSRWRSICMGFLHNTYLSITLFTVCLLFTIRYLDLT